MPVLAMILMTTEQKDEANLLNDENHNFGGRQIDNPLSNSLGLGTLVGKWIVGARLLNDPDYERWVELVSPWPIHVFDTETLFLPEEEEE